MKKYLLLFVLSGLTVFAQSNNAPEPFAVDGYAARVNGQIITYGDIRENVIPFIREAAQQYKGADLAEQIKKAYLDGREALIEEALFQEEAKSQGLTLPDHAIEEEINNLLRIRFHNDRTELARALSDRRMTYEEWRQELTDQLVMRVYYNQEVLRRATVSPEAVRAEYERIKENHIIPFRTKYRYILINKGTTPEEQQVKRAQAEATLEKLRAGADFAELSKEVSAGDTSLSPWRDLEDVREEMRPALIQTPAGQFSDLLETPTVFFIVKVEARQEKGYVPLTELSKKIETDLIAQERHRLHKRLVDRLTARHYIKRY